MASPDDRRHLAKVGAVALGAVALTLLIGGVVLSRRNAGDVAIAPPAGANSTPVTSSPTGHPATTVLTSVASSTNVSAPTTPSTTVSTIPATSTSTTVPPADTTTSSTLAPTTTSTTLAPAAELTFMVPVGPGVNASWNEGHGANYKAADIFAACDAPAVSPTNGVLLEVRRVNSYDPNVDNPATRGGRSIAILGDDGVRYYMAHFETIVDGIEPGQRVTAGQPLATIGQTGRASACHIHFGLSPDCSGPNHDGKEWSVRRGAIWPQPYLDAWRDGEMKSPRAEIDAWVAANPNACAEALADPNAPDS